MIPRLYSTEQIREWSELQQVYPGVWIPARPLGWTGWGPLALLKRLSIAWRVFTGRYDALDWKEAG